MMTTALRKIKSFFRTLTKAIHTYNSQIYYEISHVSVCEKTSKHILLIKIIGKAKNISCIAEEIAQDNEFILRFSPLDIRTITYLAAADQYDSLLKKSKISQPYEIIRSASINGKKTVQFRNTETNEYRVIALKELSKTDLIDEINSKDAYYLGYLVGQDHLLQDINRLKFINSNKNNDINHE